MRSGLSPQQVAHKRAKHILLMQRSIRVEKDNTTLVISQTLLLWVVESCQP